MFSQQRMRPLRTLSFASIALVAGALLSGCAGTTDASPTESASVVDEAARALLSDEIRDAGTVRVGLGAAFPPYAYHPEGSDTDYAGYEPELMDAIMARLGLTPEYSDVASVGDAVPTIQSGRIQVAALGITDNATREESVIFVDNLIGRNGAIFPASAEGEYESFTDMCGLTVATVTGSVSVTIVDDQNTQCEALGKPVMTTPAPCWRLSPVRRMLRCRPIRARATRSPRTATASGPCRSTKE